MYLRTALEYLALILLFVLPVLKYKKVYDLILVKSLCETVTSFFTT